MRDTCIKCCCTEDRACDCAGEPCGWIDDQCDLCSRCARELLRGPIDNLTDALLVIRAMRCALIETGTLLAQQERLLMHLAANQGMIEAGAEPAIDGLYEPRQPSPIWTP